MNVGITVTVGSVMIEASAQDCGPDACGDLMRQAITHLLVLVDTEACKVAARQGWDTGEDDSPTLDEG